MEMAQFVDSLQADLEEIAAVGDDAAAQAARRLSQAIRASAGMRLLDTLGDLALEISAQLPAGHVEVRLTGQDPQLVYVEEEQPAAAMPAVAEDATAARITLRLPEALKGSVEAAAAREGVSVNTWIVRAISRTSTAAPAAAQSGKRLTGYARG